LSLNEIVAKVNQLAESMNQLIAKKNLAIEYYNGRFVTGREFEVGTYDGQKIDLYQFEDDNDLRLLITHELGHALGFTHVDDPKAVMFYKSGQQDNKPIRLMNKDLELLVPIATKLRELSR
jgi:predicted Zn-dependent protease